MEVWLKWYSAFLASVRPWGREGGKKEGRKEGRKGGRQGGREGVRKEGRKEGKKTWEMGTVATTYNPRYSGSTDCGSRPALAKS
jgi:hypothetical protein